jgi:hypothetical protein
MTTPWLCTREDVLGALDYKETARDYPQVDRLCAAAAEDISKVCNRIFWPWQGTKFFDWPNFQRAVSWRLYLDQNDMISLDSLVTGNQTIPTEDVFLEPVNSGPPFTRLELNVATGATFTIDLTHQRSIAATGLWGYRNDEAPAGQVTADASDSTVTLLVSDSTVGVGALMRIGTERLVVTDKAYISTGQTQQADLTAQMSSDQLLLEAGQGATYTVGETVSLDSERMLILTIPGDTLVVKRAYDGSTLAAHSGATIYAPRQLTVARGVLGTTAAAISSTAPIVTWQPPYLARALAVATTTNDLLMENSGYARTVGSSASGGSVRAAATVLGNIAALTARVVAAHGRKARTRAV